MVGFTIRKIFAFAVWPGADYLNLLIICALDFDYIKEDYPENIKIDIEEINRILNGYIGYLQKQKAQ